MVPPQYPGLIFCSLQNQRNLIFTSVLSCTWDRPHVTAVPPEMSSRRKPEDNPLQSVTWTRGGQRSKVTVCSLVTGRSAEPPAAGGAGRSELCALQLGAEEEAGGG
ncbi:unnamed protein product [Pleuronectes platessa]|uniref:Uncharacterized protein n=1 Tax=Pleuronectes platessa TaxID=8262 RepID=A0A9N7YH54_PLEPL|nr:unnamed protein product [Pleuronectes platessa]